MSGECRVEDWRSSYDKDSKYLEIQGSATCKKGILYLRVYDGENFLGTDTCDIEGYIFEATLWKIKKEPASVSIKFHIEQE